MRSPTSGPGAPVAARALDQVQAQTGGLKIFDSRTEHAPGAGGFGVRRANAASCDWCATPRRAVGVWARIQEVCSAAGCPAGRRSNKRCARGRGACAGRKAHIDAKAVRTAKKSGRRRRAQRRSSTPIAFVAARWDKVSTKQGAQDYVRDILSPAKRGALGRILILNGRVFANNEGGKVNNI